MGTRVPISQSTLRRLYAHSGNQCAYPGCAVPLFEDNGLLTGECCHIEAYSPHGARYNANQLDVARNGYENLVLMCHRHHKIVDADETTYTVEILKGIKCEHEKLFSSESLSLNAEQVKALQKSSTIYWSRIEEIDKMGMDIYDMKHCVDIHKSIEELLTDLEDAWNLLEVEHGLLSKSDQTLLDDTRTFLIQLGYDPRQLDDAEYYENPLCNRHWEDHCLALPNYSRTITMLYYEVIIKLLERISETEVQEHPLLQKYRDRFMEYQKTNYYAD